MADLVADQLGKSNQLTKAQAASISEGKLDERDRYLADALAEGTHVSLTVARGTAENSQRVRAVFEADGVNINRELIDRGYGRFRKDMGGAEEQAMHDIDHVSRLPATLITRAHARSAAEVSHRLDPAAGCPQFVRDFHRNARMR